MFDKTKFLIVGEALLGVDRANHRLNAAKAQLETAKTIVETARGDIETAKEGVAAAKTNLDTILAGFDNSGLSKATILSTAEELNRVFGAIEPVGEQEVAVEPELSKASARKVIDSLRDLVSVVGEREDYADLRSPLEEILAAVQAVGGSSKDDSETKPRRKRRSKGEEDETSAPETTAVVSNEPVEPSAVSESSVVGDAVPEDTGAEERNEVLDDVTPVEEVVTEEVVAVDAIIEPVAPGDDAPAEAVAEAPADLVQDEVNNDEVRDEIIELIETNVSDDGLNNLLATTAFAVYLGSKDRALSLGDFLDAMTLETLESSDGAEYLDAEMLSLVSNLLADAAYVSSALSWFVSGVRALENGKDFPEFTGVSQGSAEDVAVIDEAVDGPETASVTDQVEEAVDLTAADDQTIVGQVDAIQDVAAEDEPLVLEEAEEVLEPVEEVTEAVEAAPTAIEAVESTPAPVEKPTPAPARPTPSAPADGLKKPNFFQRPSFPTKG